MTSVARAVRATSEIVASATQLRKIDIDLYGVAAAVVAGEAAGAGEPKLKFTVGARSAPACALKNGRAENPNMPATVLVGKRRTAVLKSWTAPLKLFRSTEIRFSVPSSCACSPRKFWFDFNSG